MDPEEFPRFHWKTSLKLFSYFSRPIGQVFKSFFLPLAQIWCQNCYQILFCYFIKEIPKCFLCLDTPIQTFGMLLDFQKPSEQWRNGLFPPVETARRLWTTVRVRATPKNPGPQGALMNLWWLRQLTLIRRNNVSIHKIMFRLCDVISFKIIKNYNKPWKQWRFWNLVYTVKFGGY